MRVSSLSDQRIIALIAKYFVPVWHSRDAYQLAEPSREELAELLRIDRDRSKRGLRGGTVCVFLLSPDGAVAATLPVQQAYKSENLAPFLEQFIRSQGLRPRDADAVRATRAGSRVARPVVPPGGLLLHTWAREDNGPNRGTSQDWVAWNAGELATLIPGPGITAGKSWEVPAAVVDKLLARCYPPSPSWSVNASKVLRSKLVATPGAGSGKEMRVRLDGRVELIHPAEGKETDRRVKAKLLGYLHYDLAERAVTSFVMTSVEAELVWYWQGKPQPRKMRFGVEQERNKPPRD
jgi:hypothetical protein